MLRTLSRSLLLALPVGTLVALSSGCGSGGDDGGGSGVGGTKTIGNLTDAERAQICDWIAGLYGGYGKSTTCPDAGEVAGPVTQADCLAQAASISPSCAVTVAQEENCVKAVRACAWSAATAPCTALQACLLP
jgi:hypothetical protein